MAFQPDIWKVVEQRKMDNQRLNNPPRWKVDQFTEAAPRPRRRPGPAFVWLGRNLINLGTWLQNRYGDTCVIQVDCDPQTAHG